MSIRVRRLWRNLRHRGRIDRELDDELRAMFDVLVDEQRARGLPEAQARRAAALALQIEPVKERIRDVKAGVAMERLLQDIKYAWRHLKRSPGFSVAAVLTLMLGVGANTAVFSMLNTLHLKRLAIEDPDGLLAIAPINSRGATRTVPMDAIAHLQDGPLDHLCAYIGGVVFPVLANDVPMQATTSFVTGRCFNVLGVSPMLGRSITDADAPIYGPGSRVAVISHRLWTSAYHADRAVLGKSIRVNNVEAAIIGVLPKGFVGLNVDHGTDVFTPFDAVLAAGPVRRQLADNLLGRLRPGVTREQAFAEIQTRWPAILEAVVPAKLAPSEREQLLDSIPRLESIGNGTSRVRERYTRPLTLIFGLTTLLLVLACVNLGGLLLARVTARSGELAVRLALGGTRWRIAQQMLVESVLLSLAGAALAIPFAFAVATTLASFMPPVNVPYQFEFVPDVRVLATTAAVAIAVALLMSAVPILAAVRRRTGGHLHWDRTIVRTTNRWTRGLLVAQVALSVVMLAGAALLTRSLYLLQLQNLGVRSDDVLNVKLQPLPNAPYARGDRDIYFPSLLERIESLPGVRAAALASSFPRVTTIGAGMPVTLVGGDVRGVETRSDYVSPGFFDTMGISLIAGRNVGWSDTLKTRHVGVVSESLARAISPDMHVLERTIRLRTMPQDHELVIVGIVSNATQGHPRENRPHVVYRPALQNPANSAFNPNLLIVTSDTARTADAVRHVLREAGRDYAQEMIPLDDLFARAPAMERMSTAVAVGVGALAAALASIGVHGALAYSVSRRRREIGVRLAIGASPGTVAGRIVAEGMMVSAWGVALGVPLALLAASALESLLFGISGLDPATLLAVAGFCLLLGAAASVAPAIRAARVHAVTALRVE